jgi:hypothetical protein
MEEQIKISIIYFIYLVVFLTILYFIIRFIIFNYSIDFSNKGEYNENVNLLYDEYFKKSEELSDRKLINNLAIFRKDIFCNVYTSDLTNLNLQKNKKYNILFIESCNCKFEKILINKYDNVNITITCSNIIEVDSISTNLKENKLSNRIKIYYVDENMSEFINNNKNKFDRIILRENIGKFNNRELLFNNLNKLLKNDINSFIFIKTLTFKPIFKEDADKISDYDKYLFEKQKNIIDFWNYNFSTKDSIINDLITSNFTNIEYNIIPIYLLFFSYNVKEFLTLLEIYFIDLDLTLDNIIEWFGIYTLNVLTIKVYGTNKY